MRLEISCYSKVLEGSSMVLGVDGGMIWNAAMMPSWLVLGDTQTDCMYYWTHTQAPPTPHVTQDVNKLTPMWPPTQEDSDEHKPGLKYTEADHQAAMVTLRHEYKEEVEKIQTEHKGVLDKARVEYETRLQQAIERISLLQKEVEKYKCLAGIEEYSQSALTEANAAQKEAGFGPESLQNNGLSTPGSGTPSVSQYHTPAMTPDLVAGGDFQLTLEKSPPDMFRDLTTPAELRQDDVQSETGSEDSGAIVPPPPPPAPPPPPPLGVPPAPPPMGFGPGRNLSTKPEVKTMSPMKPLFWQRIQVKEVKTPRHKEYLDKKLIWEDVQEENIDMKELDELFSKANIETSRRFNFSKPKNKAKQVAKVISPKRSQSIGILLSSLRFEMSDIEHAILTFDTSQLSEEKLRQIYEMRGDAEEMKKLKDHVKKHPDVQLDKPDQFLYDVSQIPDYSERIFCFIFREAFQESISVIETKMTNLKMTCQSLMSSLSIKRILGLVLTLGNYMNGGSKQRGQADGFGIDILPKLKDVKSKDNSISLLYFTVQQFIKKYEGSDAGTERVKIPVPDPSDFNQAALVNFAEIEKELARIKKDFEGAQERANKVIENSHQKEYLQPFKDIMTNFFDKAKSDYAEQEENLAEGRKIFQETVIFYCVKPKSGDKVVTPEYFFQIWSSFCQDFKDSWKREQQRTLKQRIKETEMQVKRRQENLLKKQPVRTRTRKAGGLKDRLATKGLLES